MVLPGGPWRTAFFTEREREKKEEVSQWKALNKAVRILYASVSYFDLSTLYSRHYTINLSLMKWQRTKP